MWAYLHVHENGDIFSMLLFIVFCIISFIIADIWLSVITFHPHSEDDTRVQKDGHQ